MASSPPIPESLWAELSPAAQAAVLTLVSTFEARIAALEARLNQNSSNSSIPPSANPPHAKPAPPKTPSGRPKGGQVGHPKAERVLLPPDIIVPLKPTRCRCCRHRLGGDDPEPLVHQVHEIPQIRPHVTEYRRHRLQCPECGTLTTAELPVEVDGGFGPRTQAVVALLGGSCRLGKRAISQVLADVCGMSISPAAVCALERKTAAALEPIAAEALTYTRSQPANVDETGWMEGVDRAWLWVAVTSLVTAFLIRLTRGRAAYDDLAGGSSSIKTTDRYGVYTHLPADQRQVCWAHLRRDFQAMIDRNNAGSKVGEELLIHADILFDQWNRVRDGTLTRRGFWSHYGSYLQAEVRALLDLGTKCGCLKTAGVCREILAVEASLWTFARVDGVEPTNNAAERALRHAVCWRKTSYRTDSEAGSRFVERILTVIASCRQQKRNVLSFLCDAVLAARAGTKPPSLLPQVA